MNDRVTSYLKQLLPEQSDWVARMEEEAVIDHVPIMDPLGMNFLMQLIIMHKPKRILEIGTAIGYSALRMIEAFPGTNVVTIERDHERCKRALEHIHKMKKEQQIDAVFGDALELSADIRSKGPYDMIFIDAAKGQYQRFFELYSGTLNSGGIVITDNVLFRGYVADPEMASPRHKKLSQKIQRYNEWLVSNPDYHTSIVPIGDGVAISIKK